ncbi:MAG: hypothetical protein Q9M40_04205 [Sulfurimonas sp.]|nr:hypothetical protein [Sulfurimonas sp.]
MLFEVSLNLTNDGNDALVNLSGSETDGYSIENYTELTEGLDSCALPVNVDGTNTTNVNTACGGNGNIISKSQLKACMQCLYSINTIFICSRDNFSIRPEAFSIQFNDQNQTTGTNITQIANDISAVNSPSLKTLNLSAGYNYNLVVSATTYTNNIGSIGYTKTLNLYTGDEFYYSWEPRSISTSSSCNDTSDKTPSNSVRFINGTLDQNSSVDQVGEYRLYLRDVTWTSVDYNPFYMGHHIGNHFLDVNTPDCIANSTEVQDSLSLTNALPLVGCEISSLHTNTNTNISYVDYNITMHPYKFDTSSLTKSILTDFSTNFSNKPYLYTANVSNDSNMSYHIQGNITAQGHNNLQLSNFVSGCYAQSLSISITTSDQTLKDINNDDIILQYKAYEYNTSTELIAQREGNATATTELNTSIPSTSFLKNANGSVSTLLNINYNRKNNVAHNPKTLSFITYNLTNQNKNNTFYADLQIDKLPKAEKDLNSSITLNYYYARTHAPRQRIVGNSSDNIFIYYEVYCSASGCDKNLLQDALDSNSTDDPRWFINSKHTPSHGSAGLVTQKSASSVLASPLSNTSPELLTLTYDESKGYPYKATMLNTPNKWLIYNKYQPSATTNSFEVEFTNINSAWAGVHETNTTTNMNSSNKTNRRTMW